MQNQKLRGMAHRTCVLVDEQVNNVHNHAHTRYVFLYCYVRYSTYS